MVLDSFSNELRFLLPLLGDLQAALQSPPDRRFVIIRSP
jgi:hypothetical protein